MTTNLDTFDSAEAASFYNEYRSNRLSPLEARLVEGWTSPGTRVLDLGCGTGRTTRPIADRGADVIGIDIAPSMIDEARRQHPDIAFEVGDATRLRFDDDAFDVVFFFANGLDCIAPQSARDAALAEIRRVLRPGGAVAYQSRNAWCMLPWPQHLAEVARNVASGAVFRGPYRQIRSPHGELLIHFGDPRRELERLGRHFDDVEVFSLVPRGLPCVGDAAFLALDPFPYYIGRRGGA